MGCVCSSIQMALKKCCTGLSASELGERGICDRPKPKTKQYRAGWSEEKAAAARLKILEVKPWLNLRGKKSPEGRAKSAMNTLKHGRYSKVHKEVERLLRQLAKS